MLNRNEKNKQLMSSKRLKDMFLGSITTILILVMSVSAFAAMNKSITVTFADIKLNINGQIITPKDAVGNTVEPFMYNGTTYLPVRAVAEALNSAVEWDQTTKTVLIIGGGSTGEESVTNPTALNLIDVLPPYTGTNLNTTSVNVGTMYYPSSGSRSVSLGGTAYKNSIRFDTGAAEQSLSFNLSSRYTLLTGIVGSVDGVTRGATISFTGDGNLLKTIDIVGGALPQDFSVDVTGVRQLTITHHGGNNTQIGLAELLIQ